MAPDPSPSELTRRTYAAVERFNEAFNRHDVDAVMAAMTEDCRFVNTTPPPDGEVFEGQAAVRAAWEAFFSSSTRARFDTEEIFACGERCVVRWRYTWHDATTGEGHVRGVDILRVRDGQVAEKLSYVKG